MDTGVLIALGLVVLLVVGVNGLLVLALRRGNENSGIRMFQNAARRARNPWEEEDRQLEELSELVQDLKEETE